MITFFYVRHGTTKGNTEFRLIGNAESPLTDGKHFGSSALMVYILPKIHINTDSIL